MQGLLPRPKRMSKSVLKGDRFAIAKASQREQHWARQSSVQPSSYLYRDALSGPIFADLPWHSRRPRFAKRSSAVHIVQLLCALA